MGLLYFYKNLKINSKIFLLVGISTIFMLLVGFNGFNTSKTNADNMNKVYNDSLLPVMWINKSVSQFITIKADILDAITDSRHRGKRADDLLATINEIKELFLKISPSIHDNKEKEMLAEVNDDMSQFYVNVQEIAKDLKNGQAQKAMENYLKLESKFDELIEDSENISKYKENTAKKLIDKGKKDSEIGAGIIILNILVALILYICIANIIANGIQKVINKLNKNLKSMSTGDLRVEKFTEISKNDIGELCSSFNAMLEFLIKFVFKISYNTNNITEALKNWRLYPIRLHWEQSKHQKAQSI